LPLVLWETPPALEMILAQEGVPFHKVRDPHPLALAAGRFVLFDGRRVPSARVRSILTTEHVALDIDVIRREEGADPFLALLDTRAAQVRWDIDGLALSERVARFPKAEIRRRLVGRIREAVTRAGGVWARLAAFPFPYRSAFNLRADLDEHAPADYARFARARRPLYDCTTHFISTNAYHPESPVLLDLLGLDTQSHGHYHVVYRDEAENRRNLERAQAQLAQAGITPVGFAAPEGRWNDGLDRVLESLGYSYSSDFQLGYDDLPFFPWRDGRFSRVLQVPVHPICEGLFFNAGVTDGQVIARHLVSVMRKKIAAGEPAFVYGHPERRLGKHPAVIKALADEVNSHALLWRVTLTEFARWWRWRLERRWSLLPRGEARFEIQLDDWDDEYPLGLEILRGSHSAFIPITAARTPLRLADLAYERRRSRADLPQPSAIRRPHSLKAAVRTALDWETVTPLDDLPADSMTARLKKRLRQWRSGRQAVEA
jgi:peptidoglycan/xylan/chitin deacetylase (PgdA/CDA1 family)